MVSGFSGFEPEVLLKNEDYFKKIPQSIICECGNPHTTKKIENNIFFYLFLSCFMVFLLKRKGSMGL